MASKTVEELMQALTRGGWFVRSVKHLHLMAKLEALGFADGDAAGDFLVQLLLSLPTSADFDLAVFTSFGDRPPKGDVWNPSTGGDQRLFMATSCARGWIANTEGRPKLLADPKNLVKVR
jgi:hypothetical protein